MQTWRNDIARAKCATIRAARQNETKTIRGLPRKKS